MSDPRWTWVIAAMAMVEVWLLGRKRRSGWALGLAKEALFVAYALASGQYGFAASGCVFLVLFARGFLLWSRRPEEAKEVPP